MRSAVGQARKQAHKPEANKTPRLFNLEASENSRGARATPKNKEPAKKPALLD